MKDLSFLDLSYEIISRFVSSREIPAEDLRNILQKSFSSFRAAGASALILSSY
jgi:threonine synthase